MKEAIETLETPEAEVESHLTVAEEAIAPDAMDGMIKAAAKMEAYDKALTTIMNTVMRRTYAGDWVSHSQFKDAVHLRSASLSGAGCERVAVILGISEKDWKASPKEMGDDGKSYSYRYEANFTMGGRTVHAYGEASTRNKFFGYANGVWKELTDIREDHVRKAAQRECQKDGIRRLLGLRKIPLLKLQELGFDLRLVHYVNFKDAKEATAGATQLPPAVAAKPAALPPAQTATQPEKPPVFETTFTPMSHESKITPKGKPYTVFTDENGGKFSKWGAAANSETIKKLIAAQEAGNRVRVSHTSEEKNGVVYRDIEEVLEVIAL